MTYILSKSIGKDDANKKVKCTLIDNILEIFRVCTSVLLNGLIQ